MRSLFSGAAAVCLLWACSDGSLPGATGQAPRSAPTSGEARSLSEAPIQPRPPSGSSGAAAESLYWSGEFSEARARWLDQLDSLERKGDSAGIADVYTWLGLAAWRLGKYGEARRFGERALALKKKIPLPGHLSRSYNALGLLAWNEGRLRDAAALFDSAGTAAAAQSDLAGTAKARANLALVSAERGRFSDARAGFLSAVDAGRALADARLEGNAWTNLAMLSVKAGDPVSALAALDSARRLYRSIEYVTGEQNAIGQLGTVYEALGEPQRALAAYDTGLRMARDQGLAQEEASNLMLVAALLHQLGDHHRALGYYARADSLNATLGLDVERGVVARERARIYAALGEREIARRQAEAALRAHEGTGARLEELQDLLLAAELADPGSEASARTALARAGALARLIGSPNARGAVALGRARLAMRGRRHSEALRTLAQVTPELGNLTGSARWEIHGLRARAYAAGGNLDSAVREGRAAVAAVEATRDRIGDGRLRATYMLQRADVYADLTLALLRQGRTEAAFAIADAARGRALMDHLATAARSVGENRGSIGGLAAADSLARRIDALLTRIGSFEPASAPERAAANSIPSELNAELAAARAEYESLMLRVAAVPDAALLGARQADVTEIRSVLHPDEALLVYFVTAQRLITFVLRSDGLWHGERAVSRNALHARSRLAGELASRRDWVPTSAQPVLGALYDDLFRPLDSAGVLDGVRSLVVVPHGPLAYVPFAALVDRTTRTFAVERWAISSLPAAAGLAEIRRRAGPEGRVGVFIAAPFSRRLPASRTEAREVRRTLRAPRITAGSQASERALREALARGDLVHLATHGVMNARSPMFSRVELARGDGSGRDDGRLEVHEVLAVRTRTPLVFLSGCETGAGPAWLDGFSHGEDYATLAQAFLFAGAQGVVATLWRIDDDGAAAFARAFYLAALEVPPAEALARAQRSMLRSDRHQAPYFWAGYGVMGGHEQPRLRTGTSGAHGAGDAKMRGAAVEP